jgi:hypothetical protein
MVADGGALLESQAGLPPYVDPIPEQVGVRLEELTHLLGSGSDGAAQ